MIWSCPVCQQPLNTDGSGWSCASNHRYDLAKEGYCNLLLANQKGSKEPGDSAEMIAARRMVLDAGVYEPLANRLTEICRDKQPRNLLDLGCGEGYYLGQIESQLAQSANLYGLDISKAAIRRAAKRYKTMSFSVASTFHPPVQAGSVDIALRVFAPAPAEEVSKLLDDSGFYLIVTPGENHLRQIREQLYRDVRNHNSEPETPEGFLLNERERVTYELDNLSSETISAIVSMTPFQWKGSEEGRVKLSEQGLENLMMDFVVSLYQKNPEINNEHSKEIGEKFSKELDKDSSKDLSHNSEEEAFVGDTQDSELEPSEKTVQKTPQKNSLKTAINPWAKSLRKKRSEEE